MNRGRCRVLTNSSEKQELQEEITKVCRKLPKKNVKRLSFPIKKFSKNVLDSSDKSENLLLYDKSDIYGRKYTTSTLYFR